jgi:hypothetical protein
MQVTHGNIGGINKTWANDPRGPLEKMRRHELRQFCKDHGVHFEVGMPATTLRLLIEQRGLTGLEPAPVKPVKPAPEPQYEYQAPEISTVEIPASTSPPVTPPAIARLQKEILTAEQVREAALADLARISDLKFTRLRKMCSVLNIPWDHTDRKPVLLEKLRGYSA